MKELVLPVGLIAIIGCMLLPLPSFVVDCLLVGNLIFSVLLVASALYISNPIKLSSLPTILLLATLYRLALNISTTRRILGAGDAGEMIEMFGELLMQGEIFVGLVVFLVITLIQFIVIAKGSERVAEVSARFTLDAMPGKQMSIDADVRSGLIDVDTARKKREALQIESRFYGALDGAMKFVKGDAIAGIVITGVNIVGGLGVGMMVHGLPVGVAIQKYTLLTLGDGLLSQIPALLNSLAAGLVVTRVAQEGNSSLASEVLDQLGNIKPALILAGSVSCLLALVGVATIPFLVLSAAFISLGMAPIKTDSDNGGDAAVEFQPLLPSLISIELPTECLIRSCSAQEVKRQISLTLQHLYESTGLLLSPPELKLSDGLDAAFRFSFRGIRDSREQLWSEEAQESPNLALQELCKAFGRFVEGHKAECIDDIFTRRLLDQLEEQAPELVANTIPGVMTITQLTSVLRELVREEICIRNIDVVLQAASENQDCQSGPRMLLEEVRIALKRVISEHYSQDGILEGVRIDPMLDMWIGECERERAALNPETLLQIEKSIVEIFGGDRETEGVVRCSRGSRRLLQECLRVRGCTGVVVLADEEISSNITWIDKGYVQLPEERAEELFEKLAA